MTEYTSCPVCGSHAPSVMEKKSCTNIACGGTYEGRYAESLYNMDPDKGAVKDDGDKIQVEFFPPEAIIEASKVFTYGATKYAPRNWEKGMSWMRVFGSLMRHLLAWTMREKDDPETKLSHLAHAMCCLSFLIAYEQRNIGEDDRPTYDGNVQ